MTELTPRQIDLLKVIIKEYTDSGEAVGSDILDKKYHLGVSPATIRNEMVELAKKGYLKKTYFSSGRVPTSEAFRFYIKYLMEEKELSTAEEVSSKSDIWDYRDETHRLLLEATRCLANKTKMMAVASTSFGDVYYFGVHYALENKEFRDYERNKMLFGRFDEHAFWSDILNRFSSIEENILFLFDDNDDQEETASVFGEFDTPKVKGMIGVIGPKRMRYDTIVPNVRHFTGMIEDILSEKAIKTA